MAYWITSSLSSRVFDDTLLPPQKTTITASDPNYDISNIERYLQGVEIKTVSQFFNSTQVKIWAGSINYYGAISHEVEPGLGTYGQVSSYAEFDKMQPWTDLIKFDPTTFVNLGRDYPFPVSFNEGAPQQEEAAIEPITIPFRLISNEGRHIARRVYAGFEDGNSLDDPYTGATNIYDQYINIYTSSVSSRPFLDSGETRFGDLVTGSILLPGLSSEVQKLVVPFSDTLEYDAYIGDLGYSGSADMSASLRTLKYGRDDSLLMKSGLKPSAAGSTCYGANVARYGYTDSIAYCNLLRGS